MCFSSNRYRVPFENVPFPVECRGQMGSDFFLDLLVGTNFPRAFAHTSDRATCLWFSRTDSQAISTLKEEGIHQNQFERNLCVVHRMLHISTKLAQNGAKAFCIQLKHINMGHAPYERAFVMVIFTPFDKKRKHISMAGATFQHLCSYHRLVVTAI